MSELIIEQLPAPQPCGLCGRPTTRYSPELDMVYCGREESPPGRESAGEFAPPMQGELVSQGRLRRRRSGRGRRSRDNGRRSRR
jgi:hypothetical protein